MNTIWYFLFYAPFSVHTRTFIHIYIHTYITLVCTNARTAHTVARACACVYVYMCLRICARDYPYAQEPEEGDAPDSDDEGDILPDVSECDVVYYASNLYVPGPSVLPRSNEAHL